MWCTIFWSVAAPSRPPNVMIGERHAKYMNIIEDKHWKLSPSLKSLKYQGNFRLRSPTRPPQNVPVNDSSFSFSSRSWYGSDATRLEDDSSQWCLASFSIRSFYIHSYKITIYLKENENINEKSIRYVYALLCPELAMAAWVECPMTIRPAAIQ